VRLNTRIFGVSVWNTAGPALGKQLVVDLTDAISQK
jgi:hypothetical protein